MRASKHILAAVLAACLAGIPQIVAAQQSVIAYPAPWKQIGATASLSATGSSSRVVLGWVATGQTAPSVAWVHNASTTVDVYVALGNSTVVATTTGVLVPAGGDVAISLGGSSYIAGITGGGSATLSIGTGYGSPLAKGGGGGGGGGSGCTPTGSANEILLDDGAGGCASLATGNNGVLVTGGTGIPSISATLPSGIAATNMALTTPALGTPSAGVLTNATGLPIGTGVSGLAANVATFLGTPSSANARSMYTDETGNGLAYFQGGDLGTPSAGVGTNLTGIPNAAVAATPLATGTGAALTGPRQYYVCTGTCTVTPPVPVAGYEFCVMNGNNVATAITLAALGSSAMYENTARTAYGTAGTGTLSATAVVANKVCILGLDSTHYLTISFTGTWTAS